MSIDNNFSILQRNFYTNNECSVRIKTDNDLQTCFNQRCSDFKDPWRVINTYLDDRSFYIHYFKLAFSNYDQLLVFIELQESNDYLLENFLTGQYPLSCKLQL